jgi:DNA-binding GntR family transcriptional regulator
MQMRTDLSPFALVGAPIERGLLKNQAVDRLRDAITGGRILPGTKLVERELAALLGISRMPVHEALVELEKEGLVVSRPDARYVIELTEKDIVQLYQVRLALERLAVTLAAQNINASNRAALNALLDSMRSAVATGDRAAYSRSDVETHRLIWQQSGNQHLQRTLNSMIGPVFMFVAVNAEEYDWRETLRLHEELVVYVSAGDADAAVKSIERHLDNALHRSLRAFTQSASA